MQTCKADCATLRRIHGRKGEELEYVEFRYGRARTRFVAQKSGPHWICFEVEAGRKGAVRTLMPVYTDREKAEAAAKWHAQQYHHLCEGD